MKVIELKKKSRKVGKITPNGVVLEEHELATIVFLTNFGYSVRLVRPSLTPKSKTPDFEMFGMYWEMKSPTGTGRSTIERTFRHAARQSENVVIDLRRVGVSDLQAKIAIEKLLNASKRVKRLILIMKNEEGFYFTR